MIIPKKQSEDRLYNYRAIKAVELTLIFIVEIVYLCILIFNKALRTAVFTNKLLFTLCLMMWIALIISFVCMLIDFNMLKNAAVDSSELSHTAYVDALTGLPNRLSVDKVIANHSTPDTMKGVGCIIIRITNLLTVNSEYNREVGDSLIQDFCVLLREVGTAYGFVGRNGGNEYLGVFESCDDDLVTQFIADLYVAINLYNMSHPQTPIEIEYAYALNDNYGVSHFSELLSIVYHLLEDNPLT